MNRNPKLQSEYENLLKYRSSINEESTKAECMTFCPYFEEVERKLKNDISVFESKCLIKKYQRSSAGRTKQLSEDIRPINVLIDVMDYLYSLLENDVSTDKFDIYKFIEDRSRAVRLDISVQGLDSPTAIRELEKIGRFLIISNYMLYNNPRFEIHLNVEQLKKLLDGLQELYLAQNGVGNNYLSETEQDFVSYFLLAHIQNKESYYEVQRFMKYPKILNTIEIYESYHRNDYHTFFRHYKCADFLTTSLLLISIEDSWLKSARCFKDAFIELIDVGFFLEFYQIADDLNVRYYFKQLGVNLDPVGLYDFKNQEPDRCSTSDLRPMIDFAVKQKMAILSYVKLGNVHIYLMRYIITSYVDIYITKKKYDIIRPDADSRSRSVLERILVYEYAKRIIISVKQRDHGLNLAKDDLVKINSTEESKADDILCGDVLAIIYNKSLHSILLKKKIMRSNIRLVNPDFISFESVERCDLLKYNLCVFLVSKLEYKYIEERYFMINKFFFLPEEPERLLSSVEGILEGCKHRKPNKDRLFNLIDGKTHDEVMDILLELSSNKMNCDIIGENIGNLHYKQPLVDCDVYF